MKRDVGLDNNLLTFNAAVVEGRDSAAHYGFGSEREAQHWARRMSSKIVANQRHVLKYGGRYAHDS